MRCFYLEKLIVDYIEGKYASCEKEDKSSVQIPLEMLPFEVKEGDVLVLKDGRYYIDYEEKEKIKAEIKNLLKTLSE